MRLWHEKLLPTISRKRLLSQHRECCALRGKGWGKKHATVNYVFKYSRAYLVAYHYRVIAEMLHRGYNVDNVWFDIWYQGKNLPLFDKKELSMNDVNRALCRQIIYPEHDQQYFDECKQSLIAKNDEGV